MGGAWRSIDHGTNFKAGDGMSCGSSYLKWCLGSLVVTCGTEICGGVSAPVLSFREDWGFRVIFRVVVGVRGFYSMKT